MNEQQKAKVLEIVAKYIPAMNAADDTAPGSLWIELCEVLAEGNPDEGDEGDE